MRRLEMIYGQPFHMRPDAWHGLHQQHVADLQAGGPRARTAPKYGEDPDKVFMFSKRPAADMWGDEFAKMEMAGDVAIIPVAGGLIKGATGSDKYIMSVTSHEDINEDIDAAISSGAKKMLFNFHTPGGTVMGTPETAKRMADIGKHGIQTFGYCEGLCCSAGYYMAAGLSGLFCTPSAVVGSIGTIWETMNVVGWLEKMGIEFNIFTSGPLKGVGHPARQLTDEQKAWMQSVVDASSREFKAHVTQSRPAVKAETMQGQIFTGAEACANGLFDATVSGLKEALAIIR